MEAAASKRLGDFRRATPCREIKPCTLAERERCAAYRDEGAPCWALEHTACRAENYDRRLCPVYNWASYCASMKALLRQDGHS